MVPDLNSTIAVASQNPMSEFLLVMAIVFALYAAALALIIALKYGKEPFSPDTQKEGKRKFYRGMKAGITDGTVTTITDVENIYKAIVGGRLESNYQKNLNLWLREFNYDILSRNPLLHIDSDKDLNFKLDDELIKKSKKLLGDFINEFDEKAPFTELPDAERYLLNDLLFVSSQNETLKQTVNPKLLELAGLIKDRNDEVENQKIINLIALGTAVFGIFLTLFFGFHIFNL
jgi:hypothetical protein